MSFWSRLSFAFAVLTGRVSPPEPVTGILEVDMEFAKTEAQIATLKDAIARAVANAAGQTQTIGDLRTDNANLADANATLTQSLADADTQLANDLQPVVDAALNLAPLPAQ